MTVYIATTKLLDGEIVMSITDEVDCLPPDCRILCAVEVDNVDVELVRREANT